ncbi:hypothetical protein [Streptomyces palmae]|uniref:Uncharacterized protein n=2 Tax=Streptomyces palmae TaxID=1701085 RepID=A0A4Z0H1T6_9ACTN|nr:hypothetical protein [Streptomyces palmae]TGB03123.1 hypothetical protein E4099_20025 [Streptomyces palmae]
MLDVSDDVRAEIGDEEANRLLAGENSPGSYDCTSCRTPGDAEQERTSTVLFVGQETAVLAFAHASCVPSQVVPVSEDQLQGAVASITAERPVPAGAGYGGGHPGAVPGGLMPEPAVPSPGTPPMPGLAAPAMPGLRTPPAPGLGAPPTHAPSAPPMPGLGAPPMSGLGAPAMPGPGTPPMPARAARPMPGPALGGMPAPAGPVVPEPPRPAVLNVTCGLVLLDGEPRPALVVEPTGPIARPGTTGPGDEFLTLLMEQGFLPVGEVSRTPSPIRGWSVLMAMGQLHTVLMPAAGGGQVAWWQAHRPMPVTEGWRAAVTKSPSVVVYAAPVGSIGSQPREDQLREALERAAARGALVAAVMPLSGT